MIDKTTPQEAVKAIFGCRQDAIAVNAVLIFVGELEEYRKLFGKRVSWFKGWVKGFTGVPKGCGQPVTVIKTTQFFVPDCAYFLRFTPCRNLVYSGAIGGLMAAEIGDIIVPDSAYVGEGFSQYFSQRKEAIASRRLTSALRKELEGDGAAIGGRIFTTSAFCAETEFALRLMEKRGFTGIDMETSAVFTLGNKFGINVAAAHFVSDLPAKESFAIPPSRQEKKRIEKAKKIIRERTTALLGTYRG